MTIGSQTAAYDYDQADRMRTATVGGVTTTCGYDGDGTRTTAMRNGSVTNYLWDPNFRLPQLALERDGAGSFIRRYAHRPHARCWWVERRGWVGL